MTKAKAAAPAIDFEAAMAELEQIVEKLEQGDLPLEESLRQFERGVGLTRTCQAALKAAEQRVAMLLQKPGQPAEVVEFTPPADAD